MTGRKGSREVDGTFVLAASDLLDKYGFGDGELLDEAIEEAGHDPGASRPAGDPEDPEEDETLSEAVLLAVVREALQPLLHGLEVTGGWSRSHNPVRIEVPRDADEAGIAAALAGLTRDVTSARVAAVTARVAEGFGKAVVGGRR